ncbi:MAG: NAD-dependent epimerase/dehydratase family protein [Candidatus Methanomethylophilaceae archaeon]
MKVLVTGASGFLGSYVAEELIRHGHEVVAMVRENSDTRLLQEMGAEMRIGHLDKPESLHLAVRGCHAVMHLAAYYTFTGKKEMYQRINVDGTAALAEACLQEGVSHFIYCSSTEAMGPVDDPPADETTPLQPEYEYGRSKMRAESLLAGFQERGLPCTILRPSGIYGPRNLDDVAFWFIRSFSRWPTSKFMIGSGRNLVQFVHVRDVAQAFRLALEKPEVSHGQVYIVSEDRPYSYSEVYGILADVMGKKAPRIHVPAILAKAMLLEVQLFFALIRKDNFMWRLSTVDAVTGDRSYSVQRAMDDLGYRPAYDLRRGMDETVRWYRENGHIR